MASDQDDWSAGLREDLSALAADYARRAGQAGFDADQYFGQLRRLVEARARTQDLVAAQGALGGGGQNEA
jgi:hypothetical protein